MRSLFFLLSCVVIILITCSCEKRGKYKVIIPDNYLGPVNIIFGDLKETFQSDTIIIYLDSLGLARTKGYPSYQVDFDDVCFACNSRQDICLPMPRSKKSIEAHIFNNKGKANAMVLGLHFNSYRDFLLDSGNRIKLENGYFQAYIDTVVPTRYWSDDVINNLNKIGYDAYNDMKRY